MRQKQKSILWWLTFPFAHRNYTTVGSTIYFPKRSGPATGKLLDHEKIHIAQQREVGVLKFVFLYLLIWPLWWNKYRWKWEWAAFQDGSKYHHSLIRGKLRSMAYGWLKNG